MEVDNEFVKDRASAGCVNHVIDVLFGKRTIPAKERPGDPLTLNSPAVGDVAQMRFDSGFTPDVFCFHDCHWALSSSRAGPPDLLLCTGSSALLLCNFVMFFHASSCATLIISGNSSGESTRSVRKRRI